MEWLAYRLTDLSARERVLVLALVAMAIPLAVAFLGVLPALEARSAARTAAAEAAALRDWVAAQVTDLPPEGLAAPAKAAAPAPIGLSGLEQSLLQAGLRDSVTQLANRPDGGVDLEFAAVDFARLMGWLHDTAPGWGYRVAAFRFERDAPGLATAAFTLAAQD